MIIILYPENVNMQNTLLDIIGQWTTYKSGDHHPQGILISPNKCEDSNLRTITNMYQVALNCKNQFFATLP